MTEQELEQLLKEMAETHAKQHALAMRTIEGLKRRNELLARQFSFYIQYNQLIKDDPEAAAHEQTTILP